MSDDELLDEIALWSPTFDRSAQAGPSSPPRVAKRVRLLRASQPRQATRGASRSAIHGPPLQLLADTPASPPVVPRPVAGSTEAQAVEAPGSQQLIDFEPHQVAEIWPDLVQPSSPAHLEASAALSKAEATQQAWKARRPVLEAAEISSHACPAVQKQCSCQQAAVLRCLDCPGSACVPLCKDCDMKHHPHAHFHRRQHCCKQFWEPLPPSCNLGPDEQLRASGRAAESSAQV